MFNWYLVVRLPIFCWVVALPEVYSIVIEAVSALIDGSLAATIRVL